MKKKNVSGEQAKVEKEEEEDWHCVDVDEEEEADLHHEEKSIIGILEKNNKKKNGINQINFHISIMTLALKNRNKEIYFDNVILYCFLLQL